MPDPVALKDRYGLSAGWKYSSGKGHYAWDIPTPTGTEVTAGCHGTVRDVNDGVANNRPGHNPGSGAPSNWVLVWTTVEGRPATVYYQHLSPGVKVRPGQAVTPDTLIGHTGNTGNSTGPHLHCSTQWGHVEPWDRYADLNNGGKTTIWPPDRAFVTIQEDQSNESEEDDDMAKIYAVNCGETHGWWLSDLATFRTGISNPGVLDEGQVLAGWPLFAAGGSVGQGWIDHIMRLPRIDAG